MFLSNPLKFLLSSSIFLFSLTGCGWWQAANGTRAPEMFETRNELPFSTLEPDVFQAEVVVSAGGTERKMFVAQKGDRRRIDYDSDGPNRRTIIYSGGKFVICSKEKIFAEVPKNGAANPDDTLTTVLADTRIYASFTLLADEDGQAKYSGKTADGASGEMIVFVDRALELPVRQEFYSIENGNRTLKYSVEFKNAKLEADDSLFEMPAGFRQVKIAEFLRRTGRF